MKMKKQVTSHPKRIKVTATKHRKQLLTAHIQELDQLNHERNKEARYNQKRREIRGKTISQD